MDFDPSRACPCCYLLVFNLFSDLSSSVESIPCMCSLFVSPQSTGLGRWTAILTSPHTLVQGW